jgi:glycosyltransferase involved in cell wall biosynthesis
VGLLGSALRRLVDVQRSTQYDVVFVQREAALFGPPVIERLIARVVKKPIVFDFDDAVHMPRANSSHGRLAALVRYPQKTPEIIGMSRAVTVGNRHLEEYASTLHDDVTLIPTVVDTDAVKPGYDTASPVAQSGPVVLGWIGTHSTYPYLESLFPVLQDVARRHKVVLRVVGAGRDVALPGVEVENRPWGLRSELPDLQSFDVGLYPIVQDAWSLGKSGYKAVQYMAVGVPVVCSPVGATCDIVQHGVHGFLPQTPQEWAQQLSSLIEDAALRRRLGQAGRTRVEEWYSLEHQAPRLASVLRHAAEKK